MTTESTTVIDLPAKPSKTATALRLLQMRIPEATYDALAAAAHSLHMDPAELVREVAGLEAWADRQGSLPAAAVGSLDPRIAAAEDALDHIKRAQAVSDAIYCITSSNDAATALEDDTLEYLASMINGELFQAVKLLSGDQAAWL